MANKNESPAVREVPQDVEVVAQPVMVTLDEFCRRLSETVVRPELIGAFAYTERHAGHVRDTSENFASRYDAFINKPV